jgi:hypothetical protein
MRSLVSGNAVYFGASAVMGGASFLTTLYLQRVLELPGWQTGLAFLPLGVAVGVGGRVASALAAHTGSKATLLPGLVIEGGGALLLASVRPTPPTSPTSCQGWWRSGSGSGSRSSRRP